MKNKLEISINLVLILAMDIIITMMVFAIYVSGFNIVPLTIGLTAFAIGLILVKEAYQSIKKDLSPIPCRVEDSEYDDDYYDDESWD